MGGGGARGGERDEDEAEERGEEGGKNGVALGNDAGKGVVDEGRVPEKGDDGAGGDGGDGSGGGGAAPEESGEDNGGECGRVDGVGVERLFEDGFNVHGLVKRPDAEQYDHEAGDKEDLFVGGKGFKVAEEDVVDEIGGGGKEPVVGGGDDFGEDGTHEERAEELQDGGAVEGVEAEVGEDFAGAVVDFARGEKGGTGDGEGDDDGFKDDGADNPADDGAGGVLFGAGGEEFLVHALVAEEQEAGGEEELESLEEGKIAENLEVGGGEGGVDVGPAAGGVDEDG